ncbi:hypothetical protein ACFQ1S_13680, partial [Kibdelosporangium lantanae]
MESPLSYTLSLADIGELQALVDKLEAMDFNPAEPRFFDQSWDLTAMVPTGVRRFLAEFCRYEPAA